MVDLKALVGARSVAVVGASADPQRIGGRPISYLKKSGFSGRIVPVNPKRSEIQGIPAFSDLRDTDPVDLAIIATPANAVVEALGAALEAQARSFILFTAGYAEVDEDGRAEQARLADMATERGAVLLGPNCLGAVDFHSGMVATFATTLESAWPQIGGFSYMGQSGALGTYWIELARRSGIGVAKWITTGNEAQVTTADALDFLADDPATSIIAAYIEDVKDPTRFALAAEKARTAGKRLLVLKSGSSPAGCRAALRHTASHTGDDAWYNGFFAEIGATRVTSMTALVEGAQALAQPIPVSSRRRLGIATVSGGAGILACDAAEAFGVGLASFSPETRRQLADVLPGYAPSQNPVDVTGAVVSDEELLAKVLAIMADSGETDTILLFLGAMEGISERLVRTVSDACAHGVPIVVTWMAGPAEAIGQLRLAGIPVYDEIENAILAIAVAASR